MFLNLIKFKHYPILADNYARENGHLSSLASVGGVASQQTTGLFYNRDYYPGYTLLSPYWGTSTYLLDENDSTLFKWDELDGIPPGATSYLTEEGNLLLTGRLGSDILTFGGILREYTPDNRCIWEFRGVTPEFKHHHDLEILPNGNLLMPAKRVHPLEEAVKKGYTVQDGDTYYLSDSIIEVKRKGKKNPEYDPDAPKYDGNFNNSCETFSDPDDIIWEWDTFDHSSDEITNPFIIDINLASNFNYVSFLPERNHVLLGYNDYHEIMIISHKYSTEETRGPKGNLLFRWGSPMNYGVDKPQKFGRQHGPMWIKDNFGYDFYEFRQVPVLIYNNNDPEIETSSVVQVTPIYLQNDQYLMNKDGTFAPEDFDFKIETVQRLDSSLKELETATFFSALLSSVQPFPNGNILITTGVTGEIIEVKRREYVVWRYVNPYVNEGNPDNVFVINQEDRRAAFDEVIPPAFLPINTVFVVYRYSPYFKGFRYLLRNKHY